MRERMTTARQARYKKDGLKRAGASLIALLFCLMGPPGQGQAPAEGDIFESGVVGPMSDSHYRWLALEQYAEDSARTGFLGRAEVLFEEALEEVETNKNNLHFRPVMLAKTLSDQGFFYHTQLKNLPKARACYERALSIFRKELISDCSRRDPYSCWLPPRREVVEGEVALLTRYAQLLNELHLDDAALRATNEANQTGAKANAPPPPHAPGVDIDFGPYMARLQERLKWNWGPIEAPKSYRTVVEFKIMKDGSLQNIRIEKSAFQSDEVAIKAVNVAAPFDPLPEGAADHVDIRVGFDFHGINEIPMNVIDSSSSAWPKPHHH